MHGGITFASANILSSVILYMKKMKKELVENYEFVINRHGYGS